MHKYYKVFLLVFGLIALDQFVKLWVHFNMEMRHAGEIQILGSFFKMHYVLNPGMAFGLELNSIYGKLILTLFRIVVSVAIFFYVRFLILRKSHQGLITSVAFVLAGALGNVVDSTFYGVFLQNAPHNAPMLWFNGQVIDMFLIDLGDVHFPSWFPLVGGRAFTYPVFNLADVFIFAGAVIILLRQGSFFGYRSRNKGNKYKYLNRNYQGEKMLWLPNSVERPEPDYPKQNDVDTQNDNL